MINSTFSRESKRRHSIRRKRRLPVGLAAAAMAAVVVLNLSGCGASAGINKYTDGANQILASVNGAKEELKQTWTMSVTDQADVDDKVAKLRKALAAAQDTLDSTDPPDKCRELDDLMGKAMVEGRALADLNSMVADYVASLAPMARQVAEIVAALNNLEDAQDISSTVTSLAQKARTLEGNTRTLNPGTTFKEINDLFTEYVASLVKSLDEAQSKLSPRGSNTERYEPGTRTEEEQEEMDDRDRDEREAQVKRVRQVTKTTTDRWDKVDAKITALLDGVRESIGLKDRNARVENYIGQSVQKLEELKQEYE